ncbi:hypothetical protein NLS1_06260 [Nocardioides sp. LS1]|nr:hypothetical protein NLS1_06260 [Nocardioides sp. LS1]
MISFVVTALHQTSRGTPPVVTDAPVPEPAEGETLVRTESAVLSHFDLTVSSRDFDIRPDPPYVGGAAPD